MSQSNSGLSKNLTSHCLARSLLSYFTSYGTSAVPDPAYNVRVSGFLFFHDTFLDYIDFFPLQMI
jgi:hypothetical protein